MGVAQDWTVPVLAVIACQRQKGKVVDNWRPNEKETVPPGAVKATR